MEITLSTFDSGHMCWAAHDGLELMWYRTAACGLHLILKVYNFCNMSKANENEWEKKEEKYETPTAMESRLNPSYCSISTFFAPASSECTICMWCRFLVMLLAVARNASSYFHAVIAQLVAINKNSPNDNNSIRASDMRCGCVSCHSWMHSHVRM